MATPNFDSHSLSYRATWASHILADNHNHSHATAEMNRSTRIIILLVIDVIFFFVELIVGKPHAAAASPASYKLTASFTGYAVGSLALVADSFHMLK